jgi:hypothetical protein
MAPCSKSESNPKKELVLRRTDRRRLKKPVALVGESRPCRCICEESPRCYILREQAIASQPTVDADNHYTLGLLKTPIFARMGIAVTTVWEYWLCLMIPRRQREQTSIWSMCRIRRCAGRVSASGCCWNA